MCINRMSLCSSYFGRRRYLCPTSCRSKPTKEFMSRSRWSRKSSISTTIGYTLRRWTNATTICIINYRRGTSAPLSIKCMIFTVSYLGGRIYLCSTSFRRKPTKECISCSRWSRKSSISTTIGYTLRRWTNTTTISTKCYSKRINTPMRIKCVIFWCCHPRRRSYFCTSLFCCKPTQEIISTSRWLRKSSIIRIKCYHFKGCAETSAIWIK